MNKTRRDTNKKHRDKSYLDPCMEHNKHFDHCICLKSILNVQDNRSLLKLTTNLEIAHQF